MMPTIHANRTEKFDNKLFEGYSDELLLFAAVICIIFMVVGIPGNALTILALSRGKQTRNSTAIFIMNLSCSDLLFGCFNLPLAISTFLRRSWVHGDLLCRLFPLLRYGLLAVSLFTVSFITINRYIIIAHPRQYPRIYQHRYVALMVASTWITAFSFMIPTWRGIWGKFGLDIEIGSCSILHDKYGRSPKEFLFVIAFLVPCICIVLCYARIFYLVRKAAFRPRETTGKSVSFQTQQSTESHRKAAAKEKTREGKEKHHGAGKAEDCRQDCSFRINDADIKYIDSPSENSKEKTVPSTVASSSNAIKTAIRTSFTRFNARKSHYVSMGNTSNASSIYPGKMSQKDRRLLKMILVIFVSFVICYLPITIAKIWNKATEFHFFHIIGYLLVYLTTCINPLIYVLLSLEYRQAYISLLRCQNNDSKSKDFNRVPKK